ncbi:MAG: SDR family oxidoreductase [Dorea sp.]|nr:SDR family oxidoreductase [Dorea sp.]
MAGELKGRTAVVTGGNSGIGAAIAEAFAREGAQVAIFARNEKTGREAVRAILDAGGEAAFYQTDVTDKKQIEASMEKVLRDYGKVDAWVNSAGVCDIAPFLESDETLWDRAVNVNLKGVFFCCQAAVRAMLERGGTIVNISSVSGKKPSSWQTVYCATKFGVQGLSQSIAKEFADTKIRINNICPNAVWTDMWEQNRYDYARKRNMNPDMVKAYFESAAPMKRLVTMREIADAAIFLSTDKSGYMTGQSLNLNGGELME